MRFLMFLAYIAIEFYLVLKVVEVSGFWLFVLEIALSALLGLGILASQFSTMSAYLRDIVAFNLSVGSFFGRSIFRLLGAILLIMPGILSDIFGAIFFILSLFFKVKERDSSAFQNDCCGFRNDFSKSSDFSQNSAQESEIIEAEIIERVKRSSAE